MVCMMIEILANVYPDEAQQYLLNGTAYSRDLDKAAAALSDALESTLREVINSQSTQVLKDIGRYTAILNTTVMMAGVSGDTYVFTPVEVMPVNKANDFGELLPIKLPDGSTVMVKYKAYESDTFINSAGEEVVVESSAMGYSPSAAKGLQPIYNQRTKKYDMFNNPIGTSQSRQMVVMPIQSLDGDLVKSTSLFVNKDKTTPVPVMWVHDSSISTPGGSLLYRNAYNNVSIPRAIPQIAKFGDKFAQVIKDAEEKEFNRVMDIRRPVGIGDKGDYPALGAYLDEQYERVQDNGSYKELFLSRAHNNPVKWVKYQQRINAMLKEAEAAGWVDPGDFDPKDKKSQRYLAVEPSQFEKLVKIAGRLLQMEGSTNRLDNWAEMGERRVTNAEKVLHSNSAPGIVQMAGSLAKAPGGYDPKALPPEELASYKADKRRADLLAERMKAAAAGAKRGEEEQAAWLEKHKPAPVPGVFDEEAPFG